MKCYALESHSTNECPKSKEFKICSECSAQGHVRHQCQESLKKCLNCGENHSALAMECAKGKEIIKEKRNQVKERQNMTYSRITQATAPASLPIFNTPTIIKEELLKINICVAHAQFKNQEKPGTYKYELNRILKTNNLPSIAIPDDTDIASDNINAQQAAGTMATTVSNKEPETQIPTPAERKQSIPETSKGKIFDLSELGLELYTTKEKGWPINFTTKDLIKGIQRNI